MNDTDIDRAHAAMQAAPDDDAARLRFYERVADSEVFMLLQGEPVGDQIAPELFDIQDGKFALIFDREERLAQFVGRAAPYAGLPGRALVQMVAGQGVGLALNLEVAPSAMLIPAEAVDWLKDTLNYGPEAAEARLVSLRAPVGLPAEVITALDRKLAMAGGLAQWAGLAAATFEDGSTGHVLGFVDAVPGREDALAHAAAEALRFSGVEAGIMDVLFMKSGDTITESLHTVGLRFDIPQPVAASRPAAPGSDPEKPPKLR